MINCCKCGRRLNKVKLLYNGKPIGPECGEKLGIVEQVPKRKRLSKKKAKNPKFSVPEIERDIYTMDLFDDENQS